MVTAFILDVHAEKIPEEFSWEIISSSDFHR